MSIWWLGPPSSIREIGGFLPVMKRPFKSFATFAASYFALVLSILVWLIADKATHVSSALSSWLVSVARFSIACLLPQNLPLLPMRPSRWRLSVGLPWKLQQSIF